MLLFVMMLNNALLRVVLDFHGMTTYEWIMKERNAKQYADACETARKAGQPLPPPADEPTDVKLRGPLAISCCPAYTAAVSIEQPTAGQSQTFSPSPEKSLSAAAAAAAAAAVTTPSALRRHFTKSAFEESRQQQSHTGSAFTLSVQSSNVTLTDDRAASTASLGTELSQWSVTTPDRDRPPPVITTPGAARLPGAVSVSSPSTASDTASSRFSIELPPVHAKRRSQSDLPPLHPLHPDLTTSAELLQLPAGGRRRTVTPDFPLNSESRDIGETASTMTNINLSDDEASSQRTIRSTMTIVSFVSDATGWNGTLADGGAATSAAPAGNSEPISSEMSERTEQEEMKSSVPLQQRPVVHIEQPAEAISATS
eukprot:TRINITY_DN3829_c0_g1_i1.p1 TRINITY_DN3829_c0_g1~~TRINITY_DN3829_c0_g1_i1.p1  ORF type:complete len:370 (+),score=97.63 TRINITY_DN3829_c0_g1_i1:695-1804(+)